MKIGPTVESRLEPLDGIDGDEVRDAIPWSDTGSDRSNPLRSTAAVRIERRAEPRRRIIVSRWSVSGRSPLTGGAVGHGPRSSPRRRRAGERHEPKLDRRRVHRALAASPPCPMPARRRPSVRWRAETPASRRHDEPCDGGVRKAGEQSGPWPPTRPARGCSRASCRHPSTCAGTRSGYRDPVRHGIRVTTMVVASPDRRGATSSRECSKGSYQ